MTESQFAYEVVQRLRQAGYEALWAGGCVRDMLLGLEPHDFDVATNARPEEIQRLFRHTLAVGASFGVIEVLGPRRDGQRIRVQVATFRCEGPYSDGRHPDRVTFTTAQEDARRRDFTINGLFYDPVAGHVIDYVGGRADLENRILRAIGDPRQRFQEDRLRMLRAIRFAARFQLTIEAATWQAIQESASQISSVSAERIAEELRRILTQPHRARAMQLLWDSGLLAVLLPELVPIRGLPQGPPQQPTGDLWDHTMAVLDRLQEPSFPLALAALLHDIGKPRVVARTPERYTFYNHEQVGKELAGQICRRLRLSNEERERIEWLVEKHQYLCHAPAMRLSKLKTILSHPGIRELLELHRADAEAWGRSTEHVQFCQRLLEQWSPSELNPAPLVSGSDVIALGLPPGPRFRGLLEKVREAQLEGTVTTREQALQLLHQLVHEPQPGGSEPDSGSPKEEA
jgi:poly(A) polymerase